MIISVCPATIKEQPLEVNMVSSQVDPYEEDAELAKLKIEANDNELYRMLTGSTIGIAFSMVVKVGEENLLESMWRLLAESISRSQAAICKWRFINDGLRPAKNGSHYELAMSRWDADTDKLVAYQDVEAVPEDASRITTYYHTFPPNGGDYCGGFRSQMRQHINCLIRGTMTKSAPLARVNDEAGWPELPTETHSPNNEAKRINAPTKAKGSKR